MRLLPSNSQQKTVKALQSRVLRGVSCLLRSRYVHISVDNFNENRRPWKRAAMEHPTRRRWTAPLATSRAVELEAKPEQTTEQTRTSKNSFKSFKKQRNTHGNMKRSEAKNHMREALNTYKIVARLHRTRTNLQHLFGRLEDTLCPRLTGLGRFSVHFPLCFRALLKELT